MSFFATLKTPKSPFNLTLNAKKNNKINVSTNFTLHNYICCDIIRV